MKRLATLSLAITCLGAPALANACGGMFCSGAPQGPAQAPQPVDQNAERIIFEVTAKNVIAHIQIQVTGESKDFAWVVPLTAVPEFGTSSLTLFQNIDAMSRFTVTFPAADNTNCRNATYAPVSSGGGFGCGSTDTAATYDSPSNAGSARSTPENSTVTVYASETFGAFKSDVIGGEKTADIVKWLKDHNYNVSENMIPAFDVYNKPGMKFAALKLQRDKTVADVEPIKLILPAGTPCVPIRLTRVSAQPLMGIQIYILADTPFAPQNYTFGPPDPKSISFFVSGQTNYFTWVARTASDFGGRWFVQERIMPLSDPLAQLAKNFDAATKAMVDGHKWLSRYYTRMSPEAMTEDPEFFATPNAPETPKVLDLSTRPTLWGCVGADVVAKRTPGPCANVFCGEKATCYEDGGTAKCQCAAGDVIQSFTGPDGNPSFTCVPAKNPYGVTPETVVSKDGTSDPCKTLSCVGESTCVLRGGFPTCQCKNGAGFALKGAVVCGPLGKGALSRGTGGGSESVLPTQLSALLEVERPWDGRVGVAATSVLVMLMLAGMSRRRRGV